MATLYQRHVDKWSTCEACSLCTTRSNVVLLRGYVPCDVLFIGEAPGPAEDAIGIPFIGPAGKLLDQIISQSIPENVRYALTNLVACIPLDEDGDKFKQPPKESIEACSGRLIEIMEICNPKLVILVGDLAKTHAPTSDGWATRSIIHPAAILRAEPAQKPLMVKRSIVAIIDAIAEQFG